MPGAIDVFEREFCKGRTGERCLECKYATPIDEFWLRCKNKNSKLPHHPNYVCSKFEKFENDGLGILNLKR